VLNNLTTQSRNSDNERSMAQTAEERLDVNESIVTSTCLAALAQRSGAALLTASKLFK